MGARDSKGGFHVLVAGLLIGCAACGGSAAKVPVSPSTQAVITSPTPDSATLNYLALVENYWTVYKIAEGDPLHFARVCWGLHDWNTPSDIQLVDPPSCRLVAVAILPGHEKFLSVLGTTPAPPKFAADDQVFRAQLPKAIAAIKAMISDAAAGNKNAVLQEMTAYANDMMPTVTNALDDVDPSVVHT